MKNWNHKLAMLMMTGLCTASLLTGCGSPAQETRETAEVSSFGSVLAEASETEASAAPETAEASAEISAAETVIPEASAAQEASEATAEAEQENDNTPQTPVETQAVVTTLSASTVSGLLDPAELFTDRDLTQTPDLEGAEYLTVADGEDIQITAEGVYVLSGSASNVTVYVEAPSDAKVELVLDGVNITNDDFPCIYVTEADKVFVTSQGENSLTVSGTFTADGDTNTDGVIFSRSDLTLCGTGTLAISSTDNGVVSKDDLKITGGTYTISASSKCLEANDSIRIAGGDLNLTAGTDGIHAENDEDDTTGYVYICGGSITISAGDDAIHGVSLVEIDGGSITIDAAEGIEGTYIQINGGSITVNASDDGINAAQKSSAYLATIEINDGELTVNMGAGDTDGIDSNGDLYINGGTVSVTGQSAFDYDGTGEFNGGTLIVNGVETDTLPNQMMGGRGRMW